MDKKVSFIERLDETIDRIKEQHERVCAGDPANNLPPGARWTGASQSDGVLRGAGDPNGSVAIATDLTRGLSAQCPRTLGGCGGLGTSYDGTAICPVCGGRGRTATIAGLALLEWLRQELEGALTPAAHPDAIAAAVAKRATQEASQAKALEQRAARKDAEDKILAETAARIDAVRKGPFAGADEEDADNMVAKQAATRAPSSPRAGR